MRSAALPAAVGARANAIHGSPGRHRKCLESRGGL